MILLLYQEKTSSLTKRDVFISVLSSADPNLHNQEIQANSRDFKKAFSAVSHRTIQEEKAFLIYNNHHIYNI